jgi:hypothetical protein
MESAMTLHNPLTDRCGAGTEGCLLSLAGSTHSPARQHLGDRDWPQQEERFGPTGAVNLNPLDRNRFRRKRFGALLTQELNHGGRRGRDRPRQIRDYTVTSWQTRNDAGRNATSVTRRGGRAFRDGLGMTRIVTWLGRFHTDWGPTYMKGCLQP